jgi:hypothetical protein
MQHAAAAQQQPTGDHHRMYSQHSKQASRHPCMPTSCYSCMALTSGDAMPKRMAWPNIQQPRQMPKTPSSAAAAASVTVRPSAAYLKPSTYTVSLKARKAKAEKRMPTKTANCLGGPAMNLHQDAVGGRGWW